MTRESFEMRLAALQQDLLKMGQAVDQAIDLSVKALANRDKPLAQQVIDNDDHINALQHDIQEQCLVLIATQQPLASDLRVISAIFSVATELERMGDYAEGIAKITLMLADHPLLKPLIDIPRMAEKGRQLLRDQLDCLMRRDAGRARELAHEDDEVDALFDQIYRELLIFMMDDPRTITRATHLMWVAHNLERASDRTTNIGESTVFMVTGEVLELN
ncbi:MAG: phosphate signaling complex protein PhoU [Chloroflexi bacterium]|nr:phosphate signaling complex protein PhoU [Chloroflexota bacterium]